MTRIQQRTLLPQQQLLQQPTSLQLAGEFGREVGATAWYSAGDHGPDACAFANEGNVTADEVGHEPKTCAFGDEH